MCCGMPATCRVEYLKPARLCGGVMLKEAIPPCSTQGKQPLVIYVFIYVYLIACSFFV